MVVGPVCETGDTFARARPLPPLRPHARVAILDTGAYGAVMSSTYNARPLAAQLAIFLVQESLESRSLPGLATLTVNQPGGGSYYNGLQVLPAAMNLGTTTVPAGSRKAMQWAVWLIGRIMLPAAIRQCLGVVSTAARPPAAVARVAAQSRTPVVDVDRAAPPRASPGGLLGQAAQYRAVPQLAPAWGERRERHRSRCGNCSTWQVRHAPASSDR